MFTYEQWQLKDTQVSARGAKSCALLDKVDKVCFTLGSKDEPTSTPFGATVFGDEPNTRKTIEFNLTPDQEEEFAKFDRWSIAYLSVNSQRLFKKDMSEDQIRENYRSPLTKKDNYGAHLRCKINTIGRSAVRCWDIDGMRTDMPDDLRYMAITPRVNISHLWIMSREFGWVFQATDLMLCQSEEICPFE
jgi:hypothetical protein